MFGVYNRLLVIAPHLDDEVLGCAGLIQKIKKAGGTVYVLFLTTGNTYDFSRTGHSEISTRQKEAESVARTLGFDDYDIAFPGDNHHLKLDVLGQKEILHAIERSSTVAIQKKQSRISSRFRHNTHIIRITRLLPVLPIRPSVLRNP